MVATQSTSPADAGDVGKLVIKRSRGEAIDIADAAGFNVCITVLSIDAGQVQLLCIAPKRVKFTKRTRQEAERDAKRPRA